MLVCIYTILVFPPRISSILVLVESYDFKISFLIFYFKKEIDKIRYIYYCVNFKNKQLGLSISTRPEY